MKKSLTLALGLVLALTLTGCNITDEPYCDSEDDEDCFVLDDGDDDEGLDEGEGETTPVHIHDYQYVETVAPTCSVIGYDVYECTTCGATEGRNRVSPLGHEIDYTTFYYTSSEHYCPCIRCSERFAVEEHDLVRVSVSDPTCTAIGVAHWECSVCDYWRDIHTDMVDHVYDFDNPELVSEPDCINEGLQQYPCLTCGGAIIEESISALGHTFSDDSVYDANNTHHWKLCDVCGGTDMLDPAACYEEHVMVDYDHDDNQDQMCYICHWDRIDGEIEKPDQELEPPEDDGGDHTTEPGA